MASNRDRSKNGPLDVRGGARAPEGSNHGRAAIETHGDVLGYFRERVVEGMRERRIVASPPTEFYLVQLLADAHAWQGATLGETLVDLYRRVHKTSGRGRLDALRVLGDRALYLAGFFGDYVERRGLSRRYFAQMGTDAYGAAHALSDRSDAAVDRARAPVFRDLAADFSGFVDLFVEVRESTSLGTPDEVLALYERFRTTRSPRIAARLARHGVFPDRLLEPRLH